MESRAPSRQALSRWARSLTITTGASLPGRHHCRRPHLPGCGCKRGMATSEANTLGMLALAWRRQLQSRLPSIPQSPTPSLHGGGTSKLILFGSCPKSTRHAGPCAGALCASKPCSPGERNLAEIHSIQQHHATRSRAVSERTHENNGMQKQHRWPKDLQVRTSLPACCKVCWP